MTPTNRCRNIYKDVKLSQNMLLSSKIKREQIARSGLNSCIYTSTSPNLKEKTSKTFKNYTMKVEKSKEMPEIRLKYVSTMVEKTKIRWSEDAYKVLLSLFNPDTIEYMEEAVVLFLTKANSTIGWARISSGGTSSTIIDPKVVFTMALNCGASYFILGHNHPSGRLEPSNEDMSITKELRMAGKLLRLDLIDHLIVTPQGFYSFADKGALY